MRAPRVVHPFVEVDAAMRAVVVEMARLGGIVLALIAAGRGAEAAIVAQLANSVTTSSVRALAALTIARAELEPARASETAA